MGGDAEAKRMCHMLAWMEWEMEDLPRGQKLVEKKMRIGSKRHIFRPPALSAISKAPSKNWYDEVVRKCCINANNRVTEHENLYLMFECYFNCRSNAKLCRNVSVVIVYCI